MKNLILGFVFIIFSTFSISAQNGEAKKIDEFGELNCEEILLRSDFLLNELNKNSASIAYIVFYEGKHSQYFYNKKTKKSDSKLVNPRRGEARNKAESIILYLTKWQKLSKEKLVLINGGYRESYGVELWIARKSKEQPKPTPDLQEKDIKFRKGKAPKVRDCNSFM